jgi:hypothetical protein
MKLTPMDATANAKALLSGFGQRGESAGMGSAQEQLATLGWLDLPAVVSSTAKEILFSGRAWEMEKEVGCAVHLFPASLSKLKNRMVG